jgi:NAD+ dependent glucose-6-phosphate dehydrogenase
MRVLITGAAGRIGNQVVEELSDSHDLCLIDLRPVRHRNSIVADLSRPPSTNPWVTWFKSKSARWSDAFKGAEVVVHLAADIDPGSLWESILPNNIQGTWNVIQTAAEYRVRRVVFASSNWAVKALEQKLAPGCYRPDGPKMDSTTAPSPLTAYGLSKAFGELAGRMFVDQGSLESFVAVRIGNYQPKPSNDEVVRARWIGVQDIRAVFRRCVEADLKGFHVVYAVSAQRTAPYDLSQTVQTLSWFPRQSAESPESTGCPD